MQNDAFFSVEWKQIDNTNKNFILFHDSMVGIKPKKFV